MKKRITKLSSIVKKVDQEKKESLDSRILKEIDDFKSMSMSMSKIKKIKYG